LGSAVVKITVFVGFSGDGRGGEHNAGKGWKANSGSGHCFEKNGVLLRGASRTSDIETRGKKVEARKELWVKKSAIQNKPEYDAAGHGEVTCETRGGGSGGDVCTFSMWTGNGQLQRVDAKAGQGDSKKPSEGWGIQERSSAISYRSKRPGREGEFNHLSEYANAGVSKTDKCQDRKGALLNKGNNFEEFSGEGGRKLRGFLKGEGRMSNCVSYAFWARTGVIWQVWETIANEKSALEIRVQEGLLKNAGRALKTGRY